MIKIYDCSNSDMRPKPRGLGGPIENDIVRYLKKYAYKHNCEFINNAENADIIFTNDVFPINYNKPKIKRMDGVYSRNDLINRNDLLNKSAIIADCVIFISEFSKNSLEKLYPEITLKKQKTILNAADPEEFYPINVSKEYDIISVANNWKRPEKRGGILLDLAKEFNNLKFIIIGENKDSSNMKNVEYTGYLSNYIFLNMLLNKSKNFVYLGFNDPAPKTLCQAKNCNLNLFITNSGGNMEIAGKNAYYIKDVIKQPQFHDKVPELNNNYIFNSFEDFLKNFKKDTKIQNNLFDEMIYSYFNIFKEYV